MLAMREDGCDIAIEHRVDPLEGIGLLHPILCPGRQDIFERKAAMLPTLTPARASVLLHVPIVLDTRADLTLGGGSASFEQTAKAGQWNGETLFDQASDRGYQLVGDSAGLDAVTTADQTAPVLGLFTPGNFPTRYAPTTATIGGADEAPVTCQPNPARLDTGLSLASLTNKAIGLLDTSDLPAIIPPDRLVRHYMRTLDTMPASLPALHTLQRLRKSGRRLAIVVDERQQPLGLITEERLLEPLMH